MIAIFLCVFARVCQCLSVKTELGLRVRIWAAGLGPEAVAGQEGVAFHTQKEVSVRLFEAISTS